MKYLIRILIVIALVVLAAPHAQASSGKNKDIVDKAVETGNFSTLATALTEAGLVDTLKSDGQFTVFAPTDEAFGKLPKDTVKKLLKPEKAPEINETCEDDPRKVLAESLAREERATAFYLKAIGESTTPRIKEVLEAIMEVEKTHIELDKAIGEKYS